MFVRIVKWMQNYRTSNLKVQVIDIQERIALESAQRNLHMHRTDMERIKGKA